MSNLIINKSYKFLHNDKNRIIMVYGGSGSGKSVAIAQLIMLDLLRKDVTINWLVIRKTAATLQDSTFKELKDVIQENEAGQAFKINETLKRFQCTTGNFCLMKGIDDPEKIKSIKGITKVWIEEATELTEKDIKQIFLRLRGVGEKKQFYFTFNPIDANHYIKKAYFDTEHKEITIKHTTYRDNKFLDDEYVAELKSYETGDYYYYTVYTLGEWGVISKAKVFHNIKIWEYDWSHFDNERWGMDFGYIHASTLMGTVERENELYLLPELYHKGLTNTQWINKVDNFGAYDKSKYIGSESAEPARIAEFRQAGFKITAAKKPKGSLKSGIDYLASFKVINIHKTKCPNAAIEFQNFKRRELKDGTITEEFVEINDDTIAAIRYSREDLALMKRTKQSAPGVSKTGVLGW